MSAFDEWYDGLVGFHVNSERLIYDLYPQENGYPDPVVVRRWMKVCWNQALEAAQNTLVMDDYYYDNGNKWNDDCYSACYPWQDIENLKEKP